MTKKSTVLVYFASIVVLVLAVVGSIGFSCYSNTRANFEYISTFTEEFSGSTAKYVANTIKGNVSAIENAAYLYGAALDGTEPDLDLLAQVEKRTGFRHVRFVSSDGTDYSSDGKTVDIRDREYFSRGMEGKSGMCFVPESRINGHKLIGFYAPVYKSDQVVGLMIGFLTEDDMGQILQTGMWEYALESYVMDTNGVVVACNLLEEDRSPQNLEEALPDMSLDDRNNVLKAVMLEREYPFFFGGFLNQSAGYVMSIDGTHWVLVEMVPSEVAFRLASNALKDNLIILLVFAVVLALVGFFVLRHFRKESKERAEAFTRQRVSSIMGILNEDYVLLSDVNLRTGKGVRYYIDSDEQPDDRPDDDESYDEFSRQFAQDFVAGHDRQRFLDAVSLANVTKALESQAALYVDFDVVVDGQLRQYQSKYVIPKGRGFKNHLLLSVRDVTDLVAERIAREKALSDARNEAEAANRAKTSFLFNMSHDIRTPMNAIVGFTNLLSKNLGDVEKSRGYVAKIQTASDFLLSLINNVLEMARIESGKMTLEESTCSVQQFNDMLVTVFEEQMQEKNLSFERSVNVEHQTVSCDALKLKEIYLNVISNAIKYTPEGGSIRMTLEELPCSREGYGLFRGVVEDTGIGMSQEYLGQVFDEFTRETNTTESRIAGTGLGMPIVKRLVDLMEGEIQIQSKLGEGTRVTIEIPHRIVEGQDGGQAQDQAVIRVEDFQGKRILLAEDNELNAEIAGEILGEVGFEVTWAKDGVECVEALKEQPEGYFALILMDVQMPRMDGYQAARAIRALDGRRGQVAILAMTANAFEEDRKNALDAGMDGHIAKPIQIPLLMQALAEALQSK
ncbi:MAG: ATP-binding protein [Coriobacteriia bacterium]|nr:ATP-binding protein [Coriobacteriia bacterium]